MVAPQVDTLINRGGYQEIAFQEFHSYNTISSDYLGHSYPAASIPVVRRQKFNDTLLSIIIIQLL